MKTRFILAMLVIVLAPTAVRATMPIDLNDWATWQFSGHADSGGYELPPYGYYSLPVECLPGYLDPSFSTAGAHLTAWGGGQQRDYRFHPEWSGMYDLSATLSLSRTVTVQPGSELSFDYRFHRWDEHGWSTAYAQVNGQYLDSTASLGDGWAHIIYPLSGSGPTTLNFTFNVSGASSSSGVANYDFDIANVQIIPEPSACTLISIVTVALLAYTWRRQSSFRLRNPA